MEKARFKFNNGAGALLCSGCSIIIKRGYEMTEKEKKALLGEIELGPQYCSKCKKMIKKILRPGSHITNT